MIKFGKPAYGWMSISILLNEKENTYTKYSASYLTDVPNDLLNGAIRMLKDNYPFVLEIDTEERGYYTIINSPIHRSLYIIDGMETIETEYEEPLNLAKNIYNHIVENKEVFNDWLAYEDDEEEKRNYIEILDKNLKELEELIKKEEA